MTIDRRAEYYAASAHQRAVDSLEFQRRYQLGRMFQIRLFQPKRTAKVLSLKRIAK